MSSNENNNNNSSGMPQRRGSITEYFRPPQQYPGPITSAAAQANHRRRMSYSGTGGLTGTSPNPPWFGSFGRRGSISSVSSTTSSPIAVDDDEKSPVEPSSVGSNSGSFARRLSFGARALRDVKRTMSFGTVGEGGTIEPEHREEPMAAMPPPPPAPAAVPKKKGPDETQERILKGDFYF